jgi:hypothetical protein
MMSKINTSRSLRVKWIFLPLPVDTKMIMGIPSTILNTKLLKNTINVPVDKKALIPKPCITAPNIPAITTELSNMMAM